MPWCGPFEPGGRIVLEDDNHGLLRVWPPLKPIDDLWQAYIQTWESLGNDPFVGRRLTTLPRDAQAEPRRSDMLFFGGCAGEAFVANFAGILEGAREAIIGATGWTGPAQEIANALMAATEEHCLGGEGEMDDRTIVVLRAL